MTSSPDPISFAINRLGKLRQKNGGFLSFTSLTPDFKIKKISSAIFSDSLILYSLAYLQSFPGAEEISEGLKEFLLSERNDQWSFNYWERGSKDALSSPYPDDLDSTSCAFAALGLLDEDSFNGEASARFAMMLSAEEVSEGGPYYTWLTPASASEWKDVDLAVNANIAYALSRAGISLENVNSFLEEAIVEDRYFSPYYASSSSVAFFVSRGYHGSKKPDLIRRLKSSLPLADNPLDLAFLVHGLFNLGDFDSPVIKKAVKSLADYCLSGDDAVFPLIIEKDASSGREYSGSLALQIALSASALARFSEREEGGKATSSQSDYLSEIFSEMINIAEERFSKSDELGDLFWKKTRYMVEKPGGKEIILIAAAFSSSLSSDYRSRLSSSFLTRLGFMNLCGWIAYSIYDDFLDDEGDPLALSLANVCLREVVSILKDMETGKSFSYCREILDGIDAANLWELLNARVSPVELPDIRSLPYYGEFAKLASRSLGHAIGPIMVLFQLGFTEKSEEMKKVRDFFSNYIIARQLNDDLRDWEEDLTGGRITPPVSVLIREATLSDNNDIHVSPAISELFWRKVVPVIAEESLSRCRLASDCLDSISGIIHYPKILSAIILSVEESAKRTLRERSEMLSFLKAIEGA